MFSLTRFAWGALRGSSKPWGDIKAYVGTDAASGNVQFELLIREGCCPSSQVLEVGCGALHASLPLIDYLDPDRFVGIDPNEWLRASTLGREDIRRLVAEKRPLFLSGDEFDAGSTGRQFDYVLSHSVLSHCAHWQLEQFLSNVGRVLSPQGRIVASLRLAEGNEYGSSGSPDGDDSHDAEWVYPGVSWFKMETVVETAANQGLRADYRPDYTDLYTRTKPNEFHDWFVFHR